MGEEEGTMKPWEQHSSIIIIPRYDYKAPSSLLQHSHSGFLVTCPIKREKSATKEAISILQKCAGSSICASSRSAENSDGNESAKRRKVCTEYNNGNSTNASESHSLTTDFDDDAGTPLKTSPSSGQGETNIDHALVLSLVKLTRSGLLLFTFPKDSSPDTVNMLANIFQSLDSRSLSSPLWCHRIFPFQATCSLNEKDMHLVVSKLVLQFVSDKRNALSQPVKFAIGYNRRGIEETEMKTTKHHSGENDSLHDLLDRNKCFSVVAAAVKGVVSDAVVNLKSPELSVLVELLPLSSVSNGSLVAAVSVLPQNLVSVKPKLAMKALIYDTKSTPDKSKVKI